MTSDVQVLQGLPFKMKRLLSILSIFCFISSLLCNQIVDDAVADDEDVGLDIPKRSPLTSQNALGGRRDIPVDDEDVKRIASEGLQMLVERSEGLSEDKILSKILSAKRQVVDGILYDIEMEIRDADGDKFGSDVCAITLVEKEWLDSIEVTSFHCKLTAFGHRRLNQERNMADKLSYGNFLHFQDKYDKKYTAGEQKRRYGIFLSNMKKIRHLQESEQGTAVYGITERADLTRSEIENRYLGLKPNFYSADTPNAEIPNISLPEEFDWRKHDVVTPVKNQMFCGSCWAFSAVGSIEGQYAIKHEKLISISEQQLVDCDMLNDGCGGGYMHDAFQDVKDAGGIESEKDYPYVGDDQTCKFEKNQIVAKVTGYVNISSDETEMAKYLVANGPYSIGLNADAMSFYKSGVSHPKPSECNPEELDHGVLLVGYGVHKSRYTNERIPYWIIKNSWGIWFGEKGYYRIFRGDAVCGMNTLSSACFVE